MFEHQRLQTDRSQIRLIRILSFQSMLELEVSSFDLDRLPEFHALSYTWGPEQPSHSIQLNGQQFVIRENLYSFFRTLFPSFLSNEHFLWIDQICIDQTSIPERNSQVAMMGEIYGRAGRVVTWLNPDQSETGLSALNKFVKMQSSDTITNIGVR